MNLNNNKHQLDQIKVGSIHLPINQTDSRAVPKDGEVKGRLSSGESIIVISMLVLGSSMQAYANNTIEAVLVALFLLLIGMALVALVFSNRKPEMRAFLLTFAVCIFVGGLAQVYSLAAFNKVQSTIDANGYFWRISPKPPFWTLATAPYSDSPLATVIWQQIYKVTWWLGFKFKPYTGVMLNSLVMGLVATLIIQITRELFGEDTWRLRRVGTLVAANGLFILFGSLLLRDCFVTFFVTLMLWGIIHWLVRPNFGSLLFAAILFSVSIWAMGNLRHEAVSLLALYGVIAFLFWIIRRLGYSSLIITILILVIVLVGGSYLASYLQDIQGIQTLELMKYNSLATSTHASDSLGLRFIYNQPLPIRIIVGSITLLLPSIPLWAHFNFNSFDYHWIKGYFGIYQMLVMPLVFAGALTILRSFYKNLKQILPFMLLLLFFLINLVAVTATSLEQRHFGQFMAAVVILAILPDIRNLSTKKELKVISLFWFSGIGLVHLVWAILKII